MGRAITIIWTLFVVFIWANALYAQITYAGGDGNSMGQAVVILGANNSYEGIEAEYQWLAMQFGEEYVVWQCTNQELLMEGNKYYDLLTVEFLQPSGGYKAGDEAEFYFDITNFFGKF